MSDVGEKYSLKEFEDYDASKPETVLDSTSEKARRVWARKGVLQQFLAALKVYEQDNELSSEKKDAIRQLSYYLSSAKIDQAKLISPEDIGYAIDVLETLGFDVKKQREQLLTWYEGESLDFLDM